MLFHPVQSNPFQSNPVPIHPIQSNPIPTHRVLLLPIPSNFLLEAVSKYSSPPRYNGDLDATSAGRFCCCSLTLFSMIIAACFRQAPVCFGNSGQNTSRTPKLYFSRIVRGLCHCCSREGWGRVMIECLQPEITSPVGGT